MSARVRSCHTAGGAAGISDDDNVDHFLHDARLWGTDIMDFGALLKFAVCITTLRTFTSGRADAAVADGRVDSLDQSAGDG
jgi:hypothetical protein